MNLNFETDGVNFNNKGKPDDIATPQHICNDMSNLFDYVDCNKKIWADIYCKTGNTLTSLKKHGVPKENIIAICPTPQSQSFVCRQLYGRLLEEIKIDRREYPEVAGVFSITRRGQVYYISNWKEIVTGRVSNTNALTIINKIILKEMRSEMRLEFTSEDDFKINNVIMNPPYNSGMDLDFVDLAYKVAIDNVVAITPAKWQTTADDYSGCASKNINYKQFREMYVPHMSHVVFYPDCKDIFDIGQRDGITWFIIDKSIHKNCTIINKCKLQKYFNSESIRCITNRESLCNVGAEIVSVLGNYTIFKFRVTTGKYQVWTNNQCPVGGGVGGGALNGGYALANDGTAQYISISRIIDTSKGEKSPSGASECTFSSDNKSECESFISWLNCKFTRFFVAINISKLTGILTDDCFRFVPAPPSGKFDHIYTDEELYKAFNLPQKYIDVIEAVIKERK